MQHEVKSQANLLDSCNTEDLYILLLNSFINDCSEINKTTVKELKYKWNPNFKISKLTYSKYNKASDSREIHIGFILGFINKPLYASTTLKHNLTSSDNWSLFYYKGNKPFNYIILSNKHIKQLNNILNQHILKLEQDYPDKIYSDENLSYCI